MKTYFIEQKIQPLANRYKVFADDELGGRGKLVAFAQQKRFAFREKFTLYIDESKSSVLLEVEARQVLDFGARYDIKDQRGTVLAVAGKAFGASLTKSTWHIFQPGRDSAPYLVVQERSSTLAIIRRLWGLLPVIGEIPFFIKYHFDFVDPKTGKVQATYDKTTTFQDHYRLEIADSSLADLDSKVFIAMGVMLDALQSR